MVVQAAGRVRVPSFRGDVVSGAVVNAADAHQQCYSVVPAVRGAVPGHTVRVKGAHGSVLTRVPVARFHARTSSTRDSR